MKTGWRAGGRSGESAAGLGFNVGNTPRRRGRRIRVPGSIPPPVAVGKTVVSARRVRRTEIRRLSRRVGRHHVAFNDGNCPRDTRGRRQGDRANFRTLSAQFPLVPPAREFRRRFATKTSGGNTNSVRDALADGRFEFYG